MIENIPRSVILAIKAAAKDIEASVKGGAYNPANVEGLSTTLERFMMGMVAKAYPTVKSSWLDKDIDTSWTRKAIDDNIVDGMKLQEAFDVWKDLDPNDRKMLETINYSKFNGQPISKLQKENKALYDAYMGGSEKGGASNELGSLPKEPMGKSPIDMDSILGDTTKKPLLPSMPKDIDEEIDKMPIGEKEKNIPPSNKKDKKGEPPAKQDLMQPGEFERNPQENEFKKGIPTKPL